METQQWSMPNARLGPLFPDQSALRHLQPAKECDFDGVQREGEDNRGGEYAGEDYDRQRRHQNASGRKGAEHRDVDDGECDQPGARPRTPDMPTFARDIEEGLSAYRALVWGIYVERVEAPREGCAPNERRIAAAVETAAICMKALDEITPESAWLAGPDLSLADVHAAPIFAYFMQAPEAGLLVQSHPRLTDWWTRFGDRPSAAKVLRL